MKRNCFLNIGVLVFLSIVAPGVFAETEEPANANPEMSYGGEILAVVDTPVIPFFTGPADDGGLKRVPNHPPIDQIPYMPMPPISEVGEVGVVENLPEAYNAFTGETVLYPEPERSGAAFGFGGGWPGPFDDASGSANEYSKSFGTMTDLTTSAGSSIYRKNAKLVMKFTTDIGGTAWYVCSGSMQDAEVVITAGHCVFSREANIMDWADEIWVYPGWDGVGTTGANGEIENYGYGVGTVFTAWTGWTNDGSTTYDVGLVRIERAVGMLTGDWGWAWGQSCGTIQGRTSWNSSYPAENCPDTGYHNGRRLFQWGGTVDDCSTTNQLHLVTTGGCFNALWGGSSGSAMYYVDTNRYVMAVASTSDRSTNAFYARLWEGAVTYMNDTFIPGARGASFDIQMMDFKADQTSIIAGNSLTNTTFFMANPTNATAPTTTWGLEVRLSTNSIISTFDSLIQDTFVIRSFAAMQAYTVTFGTQPLIPLNTPSGSYWLGILLDSGSDAINSNNDSSYWDAHPITVYGVADLDADWLAAPSGTFATGDSFGVTYNIDNLGGDPSNTITVEVRASLNTIISTFDPLLGSFSHSGLSGGGTTTQAQTVTIPAGLSGDYYVGMIVTASDDVNSGNNTTFDGTPITVFDGIFIDGFESGNTTAWSSTIP